MPINVELAGQSSAAFTHNVDARWIMAYSAALGDRWPACLDTAADTVIAHPLFPVCLE